MESSRVNRRLAAILFTDMVGYTALMAEDEVQARRLRDRHREVLRACHAKYRGEILQYFGDGTMSIFQSAVKAVQCAIDMQLAFQEEPNVPLRIGIHSGEVVLEEEGIYGSAVNIASRLESFADTASILVSGKIRKELNNQPTFQFSSLGLFDLKDVPTPVEIFAVIHPALKKVEKLRITGKGKRINALSEKLSPEFLRLGNNKNTDNSIAVLPFEDLSQRKDNMYLCVGLVDELI